MEMRSGKNDQVTSDERDSLPPCSWAKNSINYNLSVNNTKEVQENSDFMKRNCQIKQ
jgi:hypothetical protein